MPLQRLILLRHGKAEERAASGKDFDRALAPRGHAEARETGHRLAEAGFVPELALVSSAVRAKETWDEAAQAFPETRLELTPALYHASPTIMLEAAEETEASSVILVGHNPGMHALAAHLATRGVAPVDVGRALTNGFPTAAAAVFRFEGRSALCEAFFSPRDETA
jgi:phosphohistidine phosphatase